MERRRINRQGIGAILLVAALILVGFWYFTREEEPKQENLGTPYILTLRCSQTTNDPYNDMKVGDTLYHLNSTEKLGTIRSIREIDREIEEFDRETGQYVVVVHPEEKQLEVEVEVLGIRKDSYFKAGGMRLHIGQMIYPQSERARQIATIWAIEEVQS